MPIFEFECTTCGEWYEELLPSPGPRGISCVACGGVAVKRPSVVNNTLLTEERKRALSRATGKDINFSHELPNTGIEMSREEYRNIKSRRPAPMDRAKIKKTIEESVMQVKEDGDFRRQMNLRNAGLKEETKRLHEDSAKVTKG